MRRLLFGLLCVWLFGGITQAQTTLNPVQLRTQAGFDSTFRADDWLPLRVEVRNDGAPITGKLIVRPETNGRALANAYSTPIDLPTGADKTAFLYVKVRDFAQQLTIELVGTGGERYGQETVTLQSLGIRDQLYLVLTDPTATTLALGDVRPTGHSAFQTRWDATQLPDNANALEAIDVIFVTNLGDEALSPAQREALKAWVYNGGHLVAMGGANWQGVNSAVGEILPLQPSSAETLTNLDALATWVNDDNALSSRTVVTTGTLLPDARVLAAQDETPLLVRRSLGDGTVDFFAADPTLEPLVSWESLSALYFQLLASVPLPNSWGRGILETARAAEAIAILPSEELLPPVTTLIAFILVYIAMIGPVNYLILTRLKRQEWAWVTIPIFIVVFSLIAATVGFNLRGSEVLLSRLRVVRVWENTDQALEQTIVGLLSPRRSVYTLAPNDNRFLSILPSIGQTTGSIQSSVELVQTTDFVAQSFGVDGGIYSNFETARTIAKPAISGQMTFLTNDDGSQTIQGSLRNDSDFALQSPVILTRGGALQLPTLAAGELFTLDAGQLTLANLNSAPIPSRMENARGLRTIALAVGRQQNTFSNDLQTSSLILPLGNNLETTFSARTYLRREAFLQSFIRDHYNSIALGDQVYLLGWTNDIPRDLDLAETIWRGVDDTLYIVQLDVTVQAPRNTQIVTIPSDRFVWSMWARLAQEDNSFASRSGLLDVNNAGLNDIILGPDEGFVARFTPLPTAQLSEVQTLEVSFNRASGFSNQMELALWNWGTRTWDVQDLKLQTYTLEQPDAYIGLENAVMVRLVSTYPSGVSRLRDVHITLTGRP
jgi:hypothetical protein